MKIGYARVSTRDQKADLQVDALKQAGCERIYQDIASGAKSARPELDKLLANVRPGDAVVIWKLDRLGRSLKHLVELVGELAERKVGLQSLNDPIDTTHAQGRLVFNLFASLAEFERELIRERTQANPCCNGNQAHRHHGRRSAQPCARRLSPLPPIRSTHVAPARSASCARCTAASGSGDGPSYRFERCRDDQLLAAQLEMASPPSGPEGWRRSPMGDRGAVPSARCVPLRRCLAY
ncbi:resolvase (plasmid) [Pseudomonas aeruginosa VRFPA03]|nr:resolvase [Pseudomonas aeruginosa VRFPA03]